MCGCFKRIETRQTERNLPLSTAALKILIVARYADRRGGADVYTEALATQLAKENEVSLLCHSASERVHQACNVTEIVEPTYRDIKALWRFAPMFYQRHWHNSINRLNLSTPDVVISSMTLSNADLSNRFPKTPLIYLPHSRIAPVEAADIESGSRIQRTVARRLYAQSEKWSLVNAATTVRFTKGNERELRSYYDLPTAGRFHIISAPVESISTEKRNKTGRPLRFVSVGRLVASKNLRWLIEQMASLGSSNWHWTIVGDGPQQSELKAVAKRCGTEAQISFPGFCDNVGDVYRSVDLQLFPSKRESLGLVILEAMAYGVPTLAFKPDGKSFQTASDEVIVDRIDGMLAKNESEFLRIVTDSIGQPLQLLKMGEAGRQKVLDQHTWEQVATAWQGLLSQLVGIESSVREREAVHA